MTRVDINCDMGESFGLYKMGDDEQVIGYITEANVACGFHGSDPDHMRATVELARRHDVKVGAHVSFPDLQGFGRREMKVEREEAVNFMIYQTGALMGFLDVAGMSLSHLKPHGALYGVASREEHVAHAVADVAEHFRLPVFGLAGTLHETVYTARGLDFRPEFFADLDYDGDGRLVITRRHREVDPEEAAARVLRAVAEGQVRSTSGADVPVRAATICVHSDTPNSLAIARAVHDALKPYLPDRQQQDPARNERSLPVAKSEIKSPLPGTFYRRPAPDQPPYKNNGDPIAPGDVIGLVEVMKSFHEIKADAAGVLTRFVVEDAEAVMAGQDLAEIEV